MVYRIVRNLLMGASATAVALTMVWLLGGCRSNRGSSLTERLEIQEETQRRDNVSKDEINRTTTWLTEGCDSMTLSISADSVRKPDGTVVYGPKAYARRHRPYKEGGTESTDSLRETGASEEGVRRGVQSGRLLEETSESAMVTPRVPWWVWAAVSVVGALWLLRRRR